MAQDARRTGIAGEGPFTVHVHDYGQHYSLRSRHKTQAECLAEFERRIGIKGRWRPYYVTAAGPGMRTRRWENPDGIGEFG